MFCLMSDFILAPKATQRAKDSDMEGKKTQYLEAHQNLQ